MIKELQVFRSSETGQWCVFYTLTDGTHDILNNCGYSLSNALEYFNRYMCELEKIIKREQVNDHE